MRSIPFIAFAILAIVSGAAHADLGGADLNRVESYSSRRKYDALCGREKNKCVVTFKDGFFKVDNGDGIQKHQLIQIYKRTVCRRRTTLGASNCHNRYGAVPNTFDKEFIQTYMSSDGERRRGMITFIHQRTSDDFQLELEEWSGSLLRVIGPNITID